MALRRTRFFGRNVVSLLIILPIALPGIVTGLAFQNGFRTILGIQLSLWTIVIAHATFCIVTVFNNVQARFQRLGGNFEQASMDLGAGPFTTFRLITLPMLRSALLAGALLSFGLSFDEIVVTQFTASSTDRTLPIWIFQNLFRPNQAPDRQLRRRRAGAVLGDPDLPRPAAVRQRRRGDDGGSLSLGQAATTGVFWQATRRQRPSSLAMTNRGLNSPSASFGRPSLLV